MNSIGAFARGLITRLRERPRVAPGVMTAVYVLLALHAGMLAWGAARHSPTVDEPGHLVAGLRFWQHGDWHIDVSNPPLAGIVAAIPVALSGPRVDWKNFPDYGAVGDDFLAANGARSFWLVTLGRWALIPFSLLGAYVSFRWAREWYGGGAGLLALALWVFCPEMIAHGQLVTCDVTAAAVGLAAFYVFAKWLEQATAGWALAAGLLLGLAQLSKFVWVVMGPAWVVLWLVWRLARRGVPGSSWRRDLAHWAIMVLAALYVINIGYGLAGTFEPLGRYRFASRAFAPLRVSEVPQQPSGPSADEVPNWLARVPVPLPAAWVHGVDAVANLFERDVGGYFQGEMRASGRWYFYLYGWAVKLPLGTWLIFLLACACALTGADYSAGWRKELVLLGPLVVVLAFVSWVTTMQFLRYALPALPFALVWSSKVARSFSLKDRLVAVPAAAALAWSVFSSLAVYPHSGSYFNVLGGGPRGGHAHLVESSIDWGQDLFYLKDWLDAHPEARPFHLAYFGRIDPRLAGIQFSLPPTSRANPAGRQAAPALPAGRQADHGPQPGWQAVSVSLLRGFPWRVVHDGQGGSQTVSGNDYGYFLELEPAGMAGYSIYIYDVSLAQANRLRRQLGLEPLLDSAAGAGQNGGAQPAGGITGERP